MSTAGDSGLQVQVTASTGPLRDRAASWNRLRSRIRSDNVFLDPGWLTASAATLAAGRPLAVVETYGTGDLVAAGAFQLDGDVISLLGQERADYCEILLSETLDDAEAGQALDGMLREVQQALGRRPFHLRHLPERSRARVLLQRGDCGWHAVQKASVDAPAMCMSTVDEKLRKKSLRRHENGLARQGQLESETLKQADEIQPHLEAFFEQHRLRWRDTPTPSLFENPVSCEFYRRFVDDMGSGGTVRFTRLLLDDDLVAAHLGFFHGGVFTWYKPSFDVTLARSSPGEVLLKRTLEAARDEGAGEFDFTIGDEGYKLRFATTVRQVYDLHVTDSALSATLQAARTRVRRLIRGG